MDSEDSVALNVRPMSLDDLSAISGWFWSLDDVALFDRALPLPVNADALRESWRPALEPADPPRAYWYIAEGEDGHPAGICGLQSVNYIHGDAVVPVFVHKNMRVRRLATAMLVFVMDIGFSHLRLHRLTTFYREDNEATKRALDCVGFAEEGRTREGWFGGDARHDLVQAGVLKTEWLERREALVARFTGPGQVKIRPARDRDG